MNSVNKNIIILFCLFVILVIFLDLIFNFSGIVKENFYSENNSGKTTTNNDKEIFEVKSIVSKKVVEFLMFLFFKKTLQIQ